MGVASLPRLPNSTYYKLLINNKNSSFDCKEKKSCLFYLFMKIEKFLLFSYVLLRGKVFLHR